MRLTNCHNFQDFKRLAKKRLPSPVFHYIDGAIGGAIFAWLYNYLPNN
jgi:uncharacterized protein YigE (DUF2233 family)